MIPKQKVSCFTIYGIASHFKIIVTPLPSPSPRPPPLPPPSVWKYRKQALALSYGLRRYAGIQSYVLPSDPDLPEYNAEVAVAGTAARAEGGVEARGKEANEDKQSKHFRRAHAKPPTSRPAENGDGYGIVKGNVNGDVNRNLIANDNADPSGNGNKHAMAVKAAEAARELIRKLRDPPLISVFREQVTRGGRFFWTPEQYPRELVVLVVDGVRQAELLEPLYRELVMTARVEEEAAAEGGGGGGAAEVFIAVVRDGRWKMGGTGVGVVIG